MEIQTSKLSYAQAINYLAAGLGDKVVYKALDNPVIRMVNGVAIAVTNSPKVAWRCSCGCMNNKYWRISDDV